MNYQNDSIIKYIVLPEKSVEVINKLTENPLTFQNITLYSNIEEANRFCEYKNTISKKMNYKVCQLEFNLRIKENDIKERMK